MNAHSAGQSALLLIFLFLSSCSNAPQGDLDENSQLAFEIGVVSALASPSAIFQVSASDALMKRVQKTEGIYREVSAFGMIGAGRIISEGGGKILTSKISGPVNASVEIRNGEIGLKGGEIYVVEGTLLKNAEGKKFVFADGQWRTASASKKVQDDRRKGVVITLNENMLTMLKLNPDEVETTIVNHLNAEGSSADFNLLSRKDIDNLSELKIVIPSTGSIIRLADIADAEEIWITNPQREVNSVPYNIQRTEPRH